MKTLSMLFTYIMTSSWELRVIGHRKGEMKKGGALDGEEERIKNTKNV